MLFLLRLPVIRALHHRQLLVPVALILVVIAVLVLGALEPSDVLPLSPESRVSNSVPVEATRPFIRADLDKTPLTYFADYWGQLAERTGSQLISVGSVGTPGVVIGPRLVLTTLEPALEVLAARNRAELSRESPSDEVTLPSSELGPYRLLGWDREVGLALFNVTGQELIPFTLTDPRAMASGSYIGAVTLSEVGEPTVIPGYLVATMSGDTVVSTLGDLVVSMDLPETLAVAAVVNLDGSLLGLAYAAPTGRRVISTIEMLALVEQLQNETVCRSVEVTDLDENIRDLLVLDGGVLVEYVRREAFDSDPSLFGGDVLLEWAGQEVESAEQFEELYDAQPSGGLVEFRVLRNRRRISGGTSMPNTDCEPVQPEPVRFNKWGLVLQWIAERLSVSDQPAVPAGWLVVAVFPNSPSALAGVEERDWLIAVGGIAVASEQDREIIEEATDSREPLLLSLRRNERMKLVAVAPANEQVSDSIQQGVP